MAVTDLPLQQPPPEPPTSLAAALLSRPWGDGAEAPWFTIERGDGPLVGVALHSGHTVRPEVAERMALSEEDRRREEDAFTHVFTAVAPTRVLVHRSRFEVDLNRSREEAVYGGPESAWGLDVWQGSVPSEVRDESLEIHDAFYSSMALLLDDLLQHHGGFCVLDLHSYNHRRNGPSEPPADPSRNPDINLGTESVHPRWQPLMRRFAATLSESDYRGRHLDVRQNVNFRGGHFPRWVNGRYGDRGFCVAVEVKKFYADEWSGELDPLSLAAVTRLLAGAVPVLVEGLEGG